MDILRTEGWKGESIEGVKMNKAMSLWLKHVYLFGDVEMKGSTQGVGSSESENTWSCVLKASVVQWSPKRKRCLSVSLQRRRKRFTTSQSEGLTRM